MSAAAVILCVNLTVLVCCMFVEPCFHVGCCCSMSCDDIIIKYLFCEIC